MMQQYVRSLAEDIQDWRFIFLDQVVRVRYNDNPGIQYHEHHDGEDDDSSDVTYDDSSDVTSDDSFFFTSEGEEMDF